MGNRRFITFMGEYSDQELDLELPGDKPIAALMPDLIKTLDWPTIDGDQTLQYQLQTEEDRILEGNQTLIEAGIENADILRISLSENKPSNFQAPLDEESLATLDPSPQDRRGSLTPPRRVQIPITKPSLVSQEGYIFVLGDSPVLIGRQGHHTHPDIDLSAIDTNMIASRKHAEVYLEDKQYVLSPLRTTNGTFVNGIEIPFGSVHTLKNGDEIQFGFNKGVKLEFRLPG